MSSKRPFTYATGCSGICAPEQCWRDLPWTCKFRAECDLQEALVEITRLKQERAQLEHEVERLNAAAR